MTSAVFILTPSLLACAAGRVRRECARGISEDFVVVVREITESTTSAVVAALVSLLFFYGLWFGLTIYRRGRQFAPRFRKEKL